MGRASAFPSSCHFRNAGARECYFYTGTRKNMNAKFALRWIDFRWRDIMSPHPHRHIHTWWHRIAHEQWSSMLRSYPSPQPQMAAFETYKTFSPSPLYPNLTGSCVPLKTLWVNCGSIGTRKKISCRNAEREGKIEKRGHAGRKDPQERAPISAKQTCCRLFL